MKTTKRNWLVFLALMCGLLIGPGMTAQAADATAQKAEEESVPATKPSDGEQVEAAAAKSGDAAVASEEEPLRPSRPRHSRAAGHGQEAVIGHDVVVKAGETVDEVVVIRGSATVRGKVRQDAVVIFGDLYVQGEVGGNAVAVLGSVKVGTNATVKGDTVAVLGGVEVLTNASVGGDVVGVGGQTEVAEGASVRGDIVPINVGLGKWGAPRGLKPWLEHCVFRLRPLAPQVGWVWFVAGGFFLVYLFVAAVFRRPVQACVDTLTSRPATTFLFGLLTKMLSPLLVLILVVTVLGIIVVPFLELGLLVAAIVGKVALLEWIGLSLGRGFGAEPLKKPLLALVAGAVLITILYMVPVLGLITYLLVSVWGIGIAVTALFGGFRRELPPAQAVPPLASTMATTGTAATSGAGQGSPTGVEGQGARAEGRAAAFAAAGGTASAPAISSPPPPPFRGGGTGTRAEGMVPPMVPEVLAYPRAGFWERLAAAFLDVVLICLLGRLGGGSITPLVALAYFTGMWAWKGTSIGGIVLGLKVAREDGKPVTFAVALVRALATAFSIIMCFLGYLWIAWDPHKQGWHDKIAGTVVLKLPHGTPLVCA